MRDGQPAFDYFTSQVRVTTYGFVEVDGERESECVYRAWAQLTADTFDATIPGTSADLETLQRREGLQPATDGGSTRPVRVGDHVEDREEDEGATLVVVERTDHTAREYRLEGSSKTVADVNEDYPATDDVVEVVYPERETERMGDLKPYAFPVSRLQVTDPVHDQDELEDKEGDRA